MNTQNYNQGSKVETFTQDEHLDMLYSRLRGRKVRELICSKAFACSPLRHATPEVEQWSSMKYAFIRHHNLSVFDVINKPYRINPSKWKKVKRTK